MGVKPNKWHPATSDGYSYTQGTTSESIDPVIQFTQAGSYNVVLSITNSCGTFSSDPQRIDVSGAPNVLLRQMNSRLVKKNRHHMI